MTGFNILIVGIGGQGTILTSNILGEACVIEGVPVRGAETHGMAQRGGSVESQIRIGQEYGSLVAPGTADLIISFDLMESVRAKHYLKQGGRLVTNRDFVVPNSVYMLDFPAPDEMFLLSELAGIDLLLLEAKKIADEAGNPLTLNIVLLGAASPVIPLSENSLKDAISATVPPKTVDINIKAFELGRNAAQG